MWFFGSLLLLAGCSSGDPAPTEPDVPAEARPRALLWASGADFASVTLAWESGEPVRLERRDDGGSFTPTAADPSMAGWTDTTVVSGAAYEYRLVATEDAQTLSDTVWVRAAQSPLPEPPEVQSPADRDLEIRPWAPIAWNGEASRGFKLAIRSKRAGLRVQVVADLDWSPEPLLEFDDEVELRVLALGESGAGTWSAPVTFWTVPERFVVYEGYFFMGDDEAVHPGNPVWNDSYSVDRYEVTNEQFARVLNRLLMDGTVRHDAGQVVEVATGNTLCEVCDQAGGCPSLDIRFESESLAVAPGRDAHPVVNVTWFGADLYARTLGRRLPSEAEWEKAARGTTPALGDTTIPTIRNGERIEVEIGLGYPYPWGEGIDGSHANYRGSGDPYAVFEIETAPVGFFDGGEHAGFQTMLNTSPYGADDMAGNVAEWTADWFGNYRNPHAPPESSLAGKVIRGGSWASDPDACGTAYRDVALPEATRPWIGFRTVGEP